MRREPLGQSPADVEDKNPIENLRERVLKPIKERLYRPVNQLISRLGYTHCVLLLLTATGVGTVLLKAWNNPEEVKQTITVARFYIDARQLIAPRDANVATPIRDLTNQLKDASSASNRDLENGSYGPWTEAQLVVSLQGDNTISSGEMANWFESHSGTCACWRMWPATPEHLGTTAWVLLALARMGARPRVEQIDFVLHNQHVAGWWSMYPASDDPRNASTYATSFSIWALAELSRRNLIDKPQEAPVVEAISRGRTWLLDNTVDGRPGLWKDYPNGEYGEESIGVSGVALHALHRTTGPAPIINDSDWMAHLPATLPMPKEDTSSAQTVLTL
ncbi:MAG TPA: hypothetical protein VKB49_22095, partial [Candidatus Sulfotelmatobacter sp.]|nr:hypothetical protein [Candidatus Sulfotelmatobacter sp.]